MLLRGECKHPESDQHTTYISDCDTESNLSLPLDTIISSTKIKTKTNTNMSLIHTYTHTPVSGSTTKKSIYTAPIPTAIDVESQSVSESLI